MVSRNNGLRAFGVRLIPTLSNIFDVSREIHRRMTHIYVVGGFNPFEKYYSSQIGSFPHSAPGRGENKKQLNHHLDIL